MKVLGLICLTLSTDEGAIWWDRDVKGYKRGWGIMASLKAGWVYRPIPKFWKIDFWMGDKQYNPWDDEYWFVLKFWFPLLPFFSIAIGWFGFYIGFKTYDLGRRRYVNWIEEDHNRKGHEALAPSATIRMDRR